MKRLLLALLVFAASSVFALACPVDPRQAPARSAIVDAIVVGPAPPDVVRAQTEVAIARTGGHVSPLYVNLPRVLAAFEEGGARHEIIAAVIDGHMPAPGAAVQLATRRADPADSCAFIPWTVVPAKPGQDAQGPKTLIVPITRRGANWVVPVTLNGELTLDFIIDSGASHVVVPAPTVEALIKGGSLAPKDFVGQGLAKLADGSRAFNTVFKLKSVSVGGKTLENVAAVGVAGAGERLLGESFLSRFKSWSIDNSRSALVLKL